MQHLEWKDGLPPAKDEGVYLGKDARGSPFLLTWFQGASEGCWGAYGFGGYATGRRTGREPVAHLIREENANLIVAHAALSQ